VAFAFFDSINPSDIAQHSLQMTQNVKDHDHERG